MVSLRFSLLAIIAVVLAPAAWCQAPGSLRGQVTDPSGAVIPGATVTATGPGNQVKVATANQQGSYIINGLAAGNYTVRVMAKGFAVFETPVDVRSGAARTLDASLIVSLEKQEVTVTGQSRVDVDPSNNASALVLKGADLDMLSDDPDDLASDLQALAGPAAGPNGGQIYIDGFTGGRLPPKESIREIRINQSPFSAEYDKLGYGRIEIFTKPGTDKYRGNAFFDYGNDVFNSRNPFAPTKAPFEQRQFGGNISGPISKKSSFFIDLERRSVDDDAIIAAVTRSKPQYHAAQLVCPDAEPPHDGEPADRLSVESFQHAGRPLHLHSSEPAQRRHRPVFVAEPRYQQRHYPAIGAID